MSKRGVLVAVVATVLSATLHTLASGQESRSVVAQRLAKEFTRKDVSYLLLDVRSDEVVGANWADIESAVPVGSLVKPFTAMAYAESHAFRFPRHTCSGGGSCWLPRGHGELDVVHATALSCNSYYTQLASDVSSAQVTSVAQRFGLRGPAVGADSATMIGRHGAWRETPTAIARAYAELLRRRTQTGVREIVEGMAVAAKEGTASEIGRTVPAIMVLAKTGTAPCIHKDHAPGDGWVVAAWPAEAPRYLLLVRQHGKPGAMASMVAGAMIREMERQ